MQRILGILAEKLSQKTKRTLMLSLLLLSLGLIKKKQIGQLIRKVLGCIQYEMEKSAFQHRCSLRPEKIIIIRHGQSLANIDCQTYAKLPDNQIPLTEAGVKQAHSIGLKIKEIIGKKQPVFFVSPFKRAQSTAQEILNCLKDTKTTPKVITEPRIREQEWGNLQKFQKHPEKCKQIFEERNLVGRFYYRFETGESASDVYDRVSMFLETLFREMDNFQCAQTGGSNRVIVLVTHGAVMRLLKMRYFRLSIDDFTNMPNPENCEAWVLNKSVNGAYTMADKILPEEVCEAVFTQH